MRERHYSRDCPVLRVSRLRVLPVYVYCPFVVYTGLQSTSPFALPTPLRFTIATSPYDPLRVVRRLSITLFELPRYPTNFKSGIYYGFSRLQYTGWHPRDENGRERPMAL